VAVAKSAAGCICCCVVLIVAGVVLTVAVAVAVAVALAGVGSATESAVVVDDVAIVFCASRVSGLKRSIDEEERRVKCQYFSRFATV
jgi:hypothetical protein